jgi:hypothetical protein
MDEIRGMFSLFNPGGELRCATEVYLTHSGDGPRLSRAYEEDIIPTSPRNRRKWVSTVNKLSY